MEKQACGNDIGLHRQISLRLSNEFLCSLIKSWFQPRALTSSLHSLGPSLKGYGEAQNEHGITDMNYINNYSLEHN